MIYFACVRKRAFTLIELLVTISIIGLLASTLLVSFNNVKLRNDDAMRAMAVRQFISGIELYKSTYGYYPTPSTHMNASYSTVNSTGYAIYTTCLKLDTLNTCTYRNHNYIDAAFDIALSKFIITPLGKTLPVWVLYPNSSYGKSGQKADVGGIEYDCTPVPPGGAPSTAPGVCQSYMINWVNHFKSIECAGGYSKLPIATHIGYQTTNTICVYTNNDQFANAFWAHYSLPAPYF